MKRPSLTDDRVLHPAATALLEDLKRECHDADFDDESAAIADIENAIRYEDDGFRICRALESASWDCDAAMVAVMEKAAHYKYREHREAVAEWVKVFGVQPSMREGERVTFRHRGGKQHTGSVRSINAEQAQYTIFCEELGHVREGLGTHGTILNYEDCQPV